MYRSTQYLKEGHASAAQVSDMAQEPSMSIYGGFFLGVLCMLFVVVFITLAISALKLLFRSRREPSNEEDLEGGQGVGLLYRDDPEEDYYNLSTRPTDDPYEAGITSLTSFNTSASPSSSSIHNVPELQRLIAKFRHAMYASQSDPNNQESFQRMEDLRKQIAEIVMHDTGYYAVGSQLPPNSVEPPPAYTDAVSCEIEAPAEPSSPVLIN